MNRRWTIGLLGFVAGCNGGNPSLCKSGYIRDSTGACIEYRPNQPDADTDADADSDTDTDTDADTSDTPLPGPTAFNGSVTYTSFVGGVPECDAEIALVGTPVQPCVGCDFAFDIDATITTNNSAAGCTMYSSLTWLDTSYYTNTYLGWDPTYYGGTMMFGYEYYNYGFAYWFPMAYYWNSSKTGDQLDWSFTYSGYTYKSPYYGSWCYGSYTYATAPVTTYQATGAIPCNSDDLIDVWAVDAVPGSPMTITVDTTSAIEAFDPWMWVNDMVNGACTKAYADDEFDCTFEPRNYQCPGLTFTPDEDSYQVIVQNGGACVGNRGAYVVGIDHSADPNLTMFADDVLSYSYSTWDVYTVGSGTLTY